jgi:3-hydroxyisobutyrate dehydrogenase-like beta-hydroxyacid dehydrogenase
MKIGFIGLGHLGTPIAENILQSGHQLFVYNRTASKTKPLTDKGATASPDIKSLAKECAVILSIVSDDKALNSICEGSEGLIDNMLPDALHISMSTIAPQTAAELAAKHKQKGSNYLASPVFGRPEAAQARKLNFVLSGDEKLRKQAEPILKDAGAAGVWDFGDLITAANTIKLCGNFAIAAAMEAIGETAALANRSGIDAQKMWAFFGQTVFNTPVYQNYSNIIVNKQFESGAFSMQLGLKDINLVLQQAATVHQKMPLANLLAQHMQQVIEKKNPHIDWSAVAEAVEN